MPKTGQKLGLKRNSKLILDVIAGQQAPNATEAYLQIHPNAARTTAASNVHQLLQKPAAQIYLEEHISRARDTVVELMTESKKDEIRLRSAQDVLDREHGKATQKIEQQSTSVNLNLSLADLTAE